MVRNVWKINALVVTWARRILIVSPSNHLNTQMLAAAACRGRGQIKQHVVMSIEIGAAHKSTLRYRLVNWAEHENSEMWTGKSVEPIF